ncbi:hypothetical protein [Sandaracinus amylolyticus]|uniref:hypothetical protein n=1 Tax=Sandaracinus amylolyticus TaxID=927083 RepID=UPI001F4542DC|nr:hypothetical protein [Sandaracinus amylolyticus]UJR83687.1 Hypothetical protein I5071_57560 [Sandaracinus amylolyticus]
MIGGVRKLDTFVHRRVEEEGGEPGIAGEVYCDFQMLLLHALSADRAVADVEGGAAYLARIAQVYRAGGLPVGWLGLFPAKGEMLVRSGS